MTVEELIETLKQYPSDAIVYREGDEYADDEKRVYKIVYRAKAGLNQYANSILIK